MSRKIKLTEKRTQIIVGAIRDGYIITDACEMACIGRSTYYKRLEEFPDFNKAIVEATDLQWKYATWRVRHGYRSYERRHLNRPSVNYRSPNNMPFAMPPVEGFSLDELSDETQTWLADSIENVY